MNMQLPKVQDEESVLRVMREVLYPKSKPETVDLVFAYCKATDIDPLLKPYHIVQVKGNDKKTNQWVESDVIWPSITLYRIKAERSGTYLGCSAPEYGPLITEKLGEVTITYPEWCKMTFRKRIGNDIAEVVSLELWKENYATISKNSKEPNSMWQKRPNGQLAKCTEAQGLRKLYSELVGGQPTFEEMEGKDYIEGSVISSKNEKTYDNVADSVIEAVKGNVIDQTPISQSTKDELKFLCMAYDEFNSRLEAYLQRKGCLIHDLTDNEGSKVIQLFIMQNKAAAEELGKFRNDSKGEPNE